MVTERTPRSSPSPPHPPDGATSTPRLAPFCMSGGAASTRDLALAASTLHPLPFALPSSTMGERRGLVVVSNRLPVKLHHRDEGWVGEQGGGGLVQAVEPMLRHQGGVWVGWPNVAASAEPGWRDALAACAEERGCDLRPVVLTEDEVRDFYGGFANAVLWPLFHGLEERCDFNPAYYGAYESANARYAQAIDEVAGADDFIWVHDFHLIRVAAELRSRGRENTIAFFLHIPFPPLESFLKMPWRGQILGALLAFDLVGFQTERDRMNFLDCVERLVPDARVHADAGSPEAMRGDLAVTEISTPDRRPTRVGTFPIGIDHQSVIEIARSDEVERRSLKLRVQLGDPAVILGVDRLDYTKGIPERLLAFEHLLETNPELVEAVLFVQVVQPSRTSVQEYKELKQEIDALVGRINGRFGTPGWAPIHYLYRGVPWPDLFALYRLARVAMITPLKDGMNLVAKEYCACQLDEPGTLVLSEFAGAAAQLHEHAIITNPYDVEGTAAGIRRALSLPVEERAARMKPLAESVAREDVLWWTRRFLRAVSGDDVDYVAAYLPELAYDTPSRQGRLEER